MHRFNHAQGGGGRHGGQGRGQEGRHGGRGRGAWAPQRRDGLRPRTSRQQ